MGEPIGHLDAAEYHADKPELLATVLDACADLRAALRRGGLRGRRQPGGDQPARPRHREPARRPTTPDCPPSSSATSTAAACSPSLYGTVALLPDGPPAASRGFVINKFRGDPALLGDGTARARARAAACPTLGVLPFVHDVAPRRRGLARARRAPPRRRRAGVRRRARRRGRPLPAARNFTDLDALAIEPGVRVRYVDDARPTLGRPDLVVLPGTKATVADLAWLRSRGLDRAVVERRRRGSSSASAAATRCSGARSATTVESGAGAASPGLGLPRRRHGVRARQS